MSQVKRLNQSINTFMDHLTNVYKHKCEQLQEQLNHLTKQLDEGLGDIIRRVITGGGKAAAREAEERLARETAERLAREAAAREAAERAAAAAAAAAAHAAAVRAQMATLMSNIRTSPPSMWNEFFNDLYTPLEREAFIALFGSSTPEIRTMMVNGIEHSYVVYTTPNGQQAIWYTTGVASNGGWSTHPSWNPLIKGNNPFGILNNQGFLIKPMEVLNNTPGDIFVRPNTNISTTPGGKIPGPGSGGGGGSGLGNQSGGPG